MEQAVSNLPGSMPARRFEREGAAGLGDWLVAQRWITAEQLEEARQRQALAQTAPPLGAMLIELAHIGEEQFAAAAAACGGLPLWNLEDHPPDPSLKELLPPAVARAQHVVAQGRENGRLRCVAAEPIDAEGRRRLEFLVNQPIRLAIAPLGQITQFLDEFYGVSVRNMIAGMDQSATATDIGDGGDEIYLHDLREMAQEPTLINLVNLIISSAIDERASDIHIEPFETELKVKYRIDGILHEMPPPPKHLQSAIISRIKIMAGLDIAERYVPQDGQIRVNLPGARVDIRVSTVPSLFGESVVLRLLNREQALRKLVELGMSQATHVRFSELLALPYGIILTCGPTGSGKTTTLYSALSQIYTPEKKIITIEDPVEYQLPGLIQIPVRPKRGLDFPSGLRAIVRQDPDIIMVGEIRDRDTADISIRAALTGHLVFSTLHTNDAPGAMTRLLDMGVEPFLVASSIQGALGQRLVRRLCLACRKAVAPEPILREQFEVEELPEHIHAAVGCEACHGRGYFSRIGVFELLTMTERIHDLCLRAASSAELRREASGQMQSMRQDGWEKIRAGLTTPMEVLQATRLDMREGG